MLTLKGNRGGYNQRAPKNKRTTFDADEPVEKKTKGTFVCSIYQKKLFCILFLRFAEIEHMSKDE